MRRLIWLLIWILPLFPFKSKRQMRWAFANKMPWAKEWADKTKNPKKLPARAKKRTTSTSKRKSTARKRR